MLRKIAHIAKEPFLCLLSALLLIFSFPAFNLWILAWLAFVPLFFVLHKNSGWKAFLFFYLTGIIFWVGIIYWLVHVTLPGTAMLILYLALYFGFFGLIISNTFRHSSSASKLFFIPSAWVALEYIRGHLFTGFPWALLGYSQHLNLTVIQISDITGAWGVSFLIMMINVAIYQAIGDRPRFIDKKNRIPSYAGYLVSGILLFLSLGYGFYKLRQIPIARHTMPVRVSVIQGNIPQALKWMPSARAYILDGYRVLTKEAAYETPDLIIWPEASSPGILGEEDWVFDDIFSLVKETGIPLLIGSVVNEKEKYFNSALLIDESAKVTGRYDKLHLVPFGEFIPLKNFFPFLETVVPIGDMERGKEYSIFKIPHSKPGLKGKKGEEGRFAVLICFEDLFPELSRNFVREGAGFIVNITNDAWYKETSASFQHFQASVFRAVENRVFLARAANTGVSGFISPGGEIISQVKDRYGKRIFIAGFDMQEIYIPERPLTFYTRYGDIFPLTCFLFALCGIILAPKRKKRAPL